MTEHGISPKIQNVWVSNARALHNLWNWGCCQIFSCSEVRACAYYVSIVFNYYPNKAIAANNEKINILRWLCLRMLYLSLFNVNSLFACSFCSCVLNNCALVLKIALINMNKRWVKVKPISKIGKCLIRKYLVYVLFVCNNLG